MKFSARTWLIFWISYSAYIVYGTLLPFNLSLSLDLLNHSIGKIEWTLHYGRHIYSIRNVDAIVNILLFIPLGIIIFNRLYALDNLKPIRIYIYKTTVFGLLLSLVIELTQLFIETRTTSFVDFIMNTTGCFSGAIIAITVPTILSTARRKKIIEWTTKLPDILMLAPILIIGIVLTEGITLYFLGSEKVGNNLFQWRYIIEPVWIWQILCVFIPVGIFSMRVVRKRMPSIPLFLTHSIAFIVAVGIAGSIEGIKIIIYNRIPQFIPLIFGISGILIGIAGSEILLIDVHQLNKKQRRFILSVLTCIFLFIISLIFYKFAYPFVFRLDKSSIIDQLVFLFSSVYSFIPFAGIEKLLILSLQNIILFIPIGIILQEIEIYSRLKNKSAITLTISLILIMLPIILQVINQHQLAFLYELPTNTIGLFTGYFLWYGFRRNNFYPEKQK